MDERESQSEAVRGQAQRILDNKDNPTLGPDDNFVYGMPSTGFSGESIRKTWRSGTDAKL